VGAGPASCRSSSSFSALINIVAKLNTGKQITIAKRLSNYTTIQAVIEQLNSAVGGKQTESK